MTGSAIRAGEPLTEAEMSQAVAQFLDDGYFDFGPVLDTDEVDVLRADLQRKWDDPRMRDPELDQVRDFSLMRMFEYSTAFRDLIIREPFATFPCRPTSCATTPQCRCPAS
jgi:hypothetical protein